MTRENMTKRETNGGKMKMKWQAEARPYRTIYSLIGQNMKYSVILKIMGKFPFERPLCTIDTMYTIDN